MESSFNTAENTYVFPDGVTEDYSKALTCARIATYDDFKSAPRIIEVPPANTAEFIEAVASYTYKLAKDSGGSIPYTIIREVSENFIHAQFKEIVVSIYDQGNTIRFSDQGPGIDSKEKAQLPGFSSATEAMKKYIRGVGSGFPLVKEYLSFSNGKITIEDNIKTGAVVTISVKQEEKSDAKQRRFLIPVLSEREKEVLRLFSNEPSLRVTDVSKELGLATSSVYRAFSSLEQQGIIESVGKIRQITEYGSRIAAQLF